METTQFHGKTQFYGKTFNFTGKHINLRENTEFYGKTHFYIKNLIIRTKSRILGVLGGGTLWGCSGALWGCSGTFWDALGALWDALGHSGTL